MATCFICEKGNREARIIEAIYGGEIVKVCEKCAIIEGIPIIRKPTTSQLKEAEKSYTVYQRLRNMAGMRKPGEKTNTILDRIRKLDEDSKPEKIGERKPFNLVDNFHWKITRARRNKGLSQKQLSWALGESEAAIKMIEKGELPEDAEKFIRKLEQFFQIELKERTYEEREEKRKKGKKEFKIPRAESEIVKEVVEEIEEPIKPVLEEPEINGMDMIFSGSAEPVTELEKEEKPAPAKVLKFKPEIMDNITISELKKMKEEKDKEDRLVAVEEERKNALQAEALVRELRERERKKREVMEAVGQEMKDIAMGKDEREIQKRKREEKREQVPTIDQLTQKKKEKSMVGAEIELVEEEKADDNL